MEQHPSHRILGIDPGSLRMGFGLIETTQDNPRLISQGVLKADPKEDLQFRLYELFQTLRDQCQEWKPSVIAVEEPFVGRGERRFPGPAIAVGQAQGLVLIGAARTGIPVFKYPPAQVKLTVVDYGAATKEQMRQTISATLGLTETPASDAADAATISCGARAIPRGTGGCRLACPAGVSALLFWRVASRPCEVLHGIGGPAPWVHTYMLTAFTTQNG